MNIGSHSPSHIPCLNDNPCNRTKNESKEISKVPISQLFRELGNIQNPNFQSLPNFLTRATFKNLNFQVLCELGKPWKYSLRQTFKSRNFESINELGKVIS